MYAQYGIRDDQWERIRNLFPFRTRTKGRPPTDERLVLNGILWIARTGAPWRALPSQFGPWPTVYARWAYWEKSGLIKRIFDALVGDKVDVTAVMIDATIVRAHQDAHGARKKEGSQAIGISRGGPTTKLHAVVDEIGRPQRLLLTEGQVHDVTQAATLLQDFDHVNVLADKGYDSNELIDQITSRDCNAVIPPKRNRKHPRTIDRELYKSRHRVENFFPKD